MGRLTHAQLVTEAVELAGNTGLTTRAQTWLGLVLRHLSARFTFAQTGDSAMAQVEVASGTTSVTVGRASSTVFAGVNVDGIRRLLCSTAVAGDNENDWQELRLEFVSDVAPSTVSAVASRGRPAVGVIIPGDPDTAGTFVVQLSPVPNKAYKLMFIVDARELASYQYSAAQVNEYPNDMTIVQGIYAMCLKHQQDEREQAAWQLFEKMAGDDRVRYGNMNTGNTVRLNPKTFRPGQRGGNPWDWMGPK